MIQAQLTHSTTIFQQRVASARAQQRRVETQRENVAATVSRQVEELRAELQKQAEVLTRPPACFGICAFAAGMPLQMPYGGSDLETVMFLLIYGKIVSIQSINADANIWSLTQHSRNPRSLRTQSLTCPVIGFPRTTKRKSRISRNLLQQLMTG